MQRTVMRALTGAVAAALAMLAMPAASADPGDTITGGCYFYGMAELGFGVIGDSSVTRHADGTPSSATVQCWIDVNGSEKSGTRHSYSGNGVQAGADEIAWFPEPGVITLCERVTFDDGSTPFGPDCRPITHIQFSCEIPCPGPYVGAGFLVGGIGSAARAS